jgi:hypothetical protein
LPFPSPETPLRPIPLFSVVRIEKWAPGKAPAQGRIP